MPPFTKLSIKRTNFLKLTAGGYPGEGACIWPDPFCYNCSALCQSPTRANPSRSLTKHE
jgi:hypothetical protein